MTSHILCGESFFNTIFRVALHVSAWVEIACRKMSNRKPKVALHVSAWVEIHEVRFYENDFPVALHVSAWVEMGITVGSTMTIQRRTPRECVSWNAGSVTAKIAVRVSHSTWVRELKSGRLAGKNGFCAVALHVSAWVEIRTIGGKKWILCTSHSTWVRELKWTNAVPL